VSTIPKSGESSSKNKIRALQKRDQDAGRFHSIVRHQKHGFWKTLFGSALKWKRVKIQFINKKNYQFFRSYLQAVGG
jgi:hypothetical protein